MAAATSRGTNHYTFEEPSDDDDDNNQSSCTDNEGETDNACRGENDTNSNHEEVNHSTNISSSQYKTQIQNIEAGDDSAAVQGFGSNVNALDSMVPIVTAIKSSEYSPEEFSKLQVDFGNSKTKECWIELLRNCPLEFYQYGLPSLLLLIIIILYCQGIFVFITLNLTLFAGWCINSYFSHAQIIQINELQAKQCQTLTNAVQVQHGNGNGIVRELVTDASGMERNKIEGTLKKHVIIKEMVESKINGIKDLQVAEAASNKDLTTIQQAGETERARLNKETKEKVALIESQTSKEIAGIKRDMDTQLKQMALAESQEKARIQKEIKQIESTEAIELAKINDESSRKEIQHEREQEAEKRRHQATIALEKQKIESERNKAEIKAKFDVEMERIRKERDTEIEITKREALKKKPPCCIQ